MDTKKALAIALFLFFKSISGQDDCSPTSCSPTGPQVRWPFHLVNRQPVSCGFTGFGLTCNNKNETLLHLHSSQSFIVKNISYFPQIIIFEPNFCLPVRINDINLTGTPYDLRVVQRYTFFNCSSQNLGPTFQNVKILSFACLGSVNHSVFAVATLFIPYGHTQANCTVMKTISVPVPHSGDISNELTLNWFMEGFKSEGSSFSHGISRDVKYSLIFGVLFILMLLLYVCYQVRRYSCGQPQSIDLVAIAITPQPPSTTGLDRIIIHSYPKTVFGESSVLPKDEATCPICLSEYKPKESVRIIPKCNHYFHVECIDEWLKLSATCPVCRISP